MQSDPHGKTASLTHGKASTYQYHGCRCDLCRAAQTAHVRAWRRKNGNYDAIGQNRALRIAAARYRDRHPTAWSRLLREEIAKAKAEMEAKRDASNDAYQTGGNS